MENLERQQKQTIERLEQEHTNRLREEAKRIKAEQDKELSKYQNMLKNRKKEVGGTREQNVPDLGVLRSSLKNMEGEEVQGIRRIVGDWSVGV